MKHFLTISAAAVLLLSACSGSDESAQDDSASEDAEWAAQDAAIAAEEAEYLAWAESDERPVNLACMEPSYYRGQSETQIGFHSFHYPSVQAKSDQLIAQLKELTPQVTDEDIYDVEAHNDVKYDIMMLGQWGLMMSADTPMKINVIMCDHEQYDSHQCTLMARMAGNDFSIEDIVKEGDLLKFTTLHTAENTKVDVELKNPDFDGVKINVVEKGIPSLNGDWQRATDGTERVSVSIGPNESQSYTENPDCSGTARWHRLQDNGGIRKMSFTWSSVRDDDFVLTYKDCEENDLSEQQCREGGL